MLEQLDLIRTRREGNKKLTGINRDRVQKPDDPILEIPQEAFRDPVKTFADKVEEEHGDRLVGMLLFGSVARGEADRTSDVDLQVIVENDLLSSRRSIQDIRQEVEAARFGGDRFEFQVLVESVEIAEQYGEKLQEIFSEAITLHGTERLDELRSVILNG